MVLILVQKMTVVVDVVVVVQVVAVDKDVPVDGVSVKYKSEFTKEKSRITIMHR
jgi:hypothetical protein